MATEFTKSRKNVKVCLKRTTGLRNSNDGISVLPQKFNYLNIFPIPIVQYRRNILFVHERYMPQQFGLCNLEIHD